MLSTQARLVEAHNVLNILLRLGEEAVNQMVKRCAVGVLRQVALYYCFTTSLLLLYYCFTTASDSTPRHQTDRRLTPSSIVD